MKKLTLFLAIACAACTSGQSLRVGTDVGIEVTVQTALGENGNGGNVIVLRSTDGRCMYFGEVTGTVRKDGTVSGWAADVRSAACYDTTGKYRTLQVALTFDGLQPLHSGDKAVLREKN